MSVPLIGTPPCETSSDVECRPSSFQETTCDLVLTLLLPLMLLAQFASAFASGEMNTLQLDWMEVFCSIAIFAVTSICYQIAFRTEREIYCAALILLPELSTVMVCGLVLFHTMSGAYIALVTSTMLMALCMIVASIRVVLKEYNTTREFDEDEQEQKVSFVV